MIKILVFDNYDSFTYNLVHLVLKIGGVSVDVFRNDMLPLEKVKEYDKVILSPGPGIPSEAGQLLPLIQEYASTKPILGVCLGHQAIGEAFGGTLSNLSQVYHGVAMPVIVDDKHKNIKGSLFSNLPQSFNVGLYHSWIVSEHNFPETLEVTARDQNGLVMALQHKTYDVQGVQFHPESVLTPDGETIMRNWLQQ